MYAMDIRPAPVELEASVWAPGLEQAMRNESVSDSGGNRCELLKMSLE